MQKKLREWRSGAVHNLLELETTARQIRGRLEADAEHSLVDEQEWIFDLHSEITGVISYLDRTIGMQQAGIS